MKSKVSDSLGPLFVSNRRFFVFAAIWIALGVLAPIRVFAQQAKVFYLVGAVEEQSFPEAPDHRLYKGARLYELDAETMQVLRSLPVGDYSPSSAMLTADRKSIVLADGVDEDSSGISIVSVPDLKVQSHMEIPNSEMPIGESSDDDGNPVQDHIPCRENIFVHPITGTTYFSCRLSHNAPQDHFEFDPFRQRVIHANLPTDIYTKNFLYDPKRQWLYVSGMAPTILDPQNRLVGRIKGVPLADGSRLYVTGLAVLPNGNLVLLHHTIGLGTANCILAVYDPSERKVVATWKETRSYTEGGVEYVPEKVKEKLRRVYVSLTKNVPVASQDGSRLFGAEENWGRFDGSTPPPYRGVMWDAKTLRMLHTWDLPERPSFECAAHGKGSGLIACFAPAPDGRGMWFFGQSGKIYRLDDHTGELIEEVKLPFHLVSLIREP